MISEVEIHACTLIHSINELSHDRVVSHHVNVQMGFVYRYAPMSSLSASDIDNNTCSLIVHMHYELELGWYCERPELKIPLFDHSQG